MGKSAFTMRDINDDLKSSADLYLRTVIVNKKRHYIRRITKLSRNGITFLELEKYESNLAYNDNYFTKIGTTYFYSRGKYVPIKTPELAAALSKLSELHLQIILQTFILNIRIEDIATHIIIPPQRLLVHLCRFVSL